MSTLQSYEAFISLCYHTHFIVANSDVVLLTNDVATFSGSTVLIPFLLKVDGVGQELNETFQLVLTTTRDTSVFDEFRNTLDGTILDSDSK